MKLLTGRRHKKPWFPPNGFRRFKTRLIVVVMLLMVFEIVAVYQDHTLVTRQKNTVARYLNRKGKQAKVHEVRQRYGDTISLFYEGSLSFAETGSYFRNSWNDTRRATKSLFKGMFRKGR